MARQIKVLTWNPDDLYLVLGTRVKTFLVVARKRNPSKCTERLEAVVRKCVRGFCMCHTHEYIHIHQCFKNKTLKLALHNFKSINWNTYKFIFLTMSQPKLLMTKFSWPNIAPKSKKTPLLQVAHQRHAVLRMANCFTGLEGSIQCQMRHLEGLGSMISLGEIMNNAREILNE